jgi:excisionase family DNA binding protein
MTITVPINLTVPEAAKFSRMSRSALYVAMNKRSLPAVKAGRRTLIPVAALEAYLATLPAYKAGA